MQLLGRLQHLGTVEIRRILRWNGSRCHEGVHGSVSLARITLIRQLGAGQTVKRKLIRHVSKTLNLKFFTHQTTNPGPHRTRVLDRHAFFFPHFPRVDGALSKACYMRAFSRCHDSMTQINVEPVPARRRAQRAALVRIRVSIEHVHAKHNLKSIRLFVFLFFCFFVILFVCLFSLKR